MELFGLSAQGALQPAARLPCLHLSAQKDGSKLLAYCKDTSQQFYRGKTQPTPYAALSHCCWTGDSRVTLSATSEGRKTEKLGLKSADKPAKPGRLAGKKSCGA